MDKPRFGFKFDADVWLHGGHNGSVGGRARNLLARALAKVDLLFMVTVVVPTVAAIFYFGFLASDIYISETRFVVRSPDKTSVGGIGMLLKSAGFSNAGDEVYAAKDYVLSRDALGTLNRNSAFKTAYSDHSVFYFDRFNTIFTGGSFEELYKYYLKKVAVDHDNASSITTLTVRAYSPKVAQQFSEKLLEMAEATVNKLNVRGRADLIRFAQAEVDDAAIKARNAAAALSAYRNREGVVDPEKQATGQLQMVSKLQDELISTKTRLQQLRAFTPDNPQIEVLAEQARSLQGEIDVQLGKVAGADNSLSSTAARYQRLALESQFSDKQLASAMASLEEARNEARRKQAYLERIVQPGLPDYAVEPRRLRSIFATIAFSVILWGVLRMLLAGVREHQQ